jgi:pilus assembly protein CpaF
MSGKLMDRLSGKKSAFIVSSTKEEPTFDFDHLLHQLHSEVVDRLDLHALIQEDSGRISQRIETIIEGLVKQHGLSLKPNQKERIVQSIFDEICGLGPLETLLADESISDILVNTASRVYIERRGVLELSKVRFRNEEHLMSIINRIVGRAGRRIDESSPMVDARLPDGSRVNAIIPPLAIDGAQLSIRRFGTGPVTLEELVKNGALTMEMMQYLRCCVMAKCNIIISGGTGTGKTTLLNALSGMIPRNERILTIEDAAELQMQQPHVVRLETRLANIEKQGEVTIHDLVRNALRMRPDRIVVGEVRSSEVFDMIQAMNTGHEGSMTTIHANSAQDALTRLTAMLAMAGTNLTEKMMRDMVTRAVHLIVQVSRSTDGHRQIQTLSEIVHIEGGEAKLNPVFEFSLSYPAPGDPPLRQFNRGQTSVLLARFEAAGLLNASRRLIGKE